MMGLAGLVGVGHVRGVVWEGVTGTAQHSEMMLALTCLVADTMDKVRGGAGEGRVLTVCVCVCAAEVT